MMSATTTDFALGFVLADADGQALSAPEVLAAADFGELVKLAKATAELNRTGWRARCAA